VNEELPEIILSRFAIEQDHDKYRGKKEDIKIQNDPTTDHLEVFF
jgi:hypothetical protein